MMKITNRLCALALATMVALPIMALGQSYPTTNPTYIANPVLGATTFTAAGTYTFNLQGASTIYFRLSGTNTGVAGTFQVTESRAASPVWTSRAVEIVGSTTLGPRTVSVTADGLYRMNVSGAAQVRFNLTAISTGSLAIDASAGVGMTDVNVFPIHRATYHAATTVAGLTTAASLTDFLVIGGSATTTVYIRQVECTGTATAIGTGVVNGVMRSTADTGGTKTTLTDVPSDSTDPAGVATVYAYTVNPTLGTAIGSIRSEMQVFTPASATTIGVNKLLWAFGDGTNQEVVLRGVAQQFALGGGGTALPAGAIENCDVTWQEE